MKCEVCKAEYNPDLPNCPFCGAKNNHAPNIACISCGKAIDPDDLFCAHCGSTQVEDKPKKCSNCNAELKPSALFCTKCGTPVKSSVPVPPVTVNNHKFKAELIDEPDLNTNVDKIQSGTTNVRPAMKAEIMASSDRISDSDSNDHRISSKEELKTSAPPGLAPPIKTAEKSISDNGVSASKIISRATSVTKPDSAPPAATPIRTVAASRPKEDTQKEPVFTPAPSMPGSNPTVVPKTDSNLDDISVDPLLAEVKAAIEKANIQPDNLEENQVSSIAPPPIAPIVDVPQPDDIKKIDQNTETSPKEDMPAPVISSTPVINTTKVKKKRKWPFVILLLLVLAVIAGAILVYLDIIKLPFDIGLNKSPGIYSSYVNDPPITMNPINDPDPSDLDIPDVAPEIVEEESPVNNYKVIPLVSPTWDEAEPFDESGVARVKLGDKWGLINMRGDYVVEPAYDDIKPFSESYAIVQNAEKFGFINLSGNLVIPIEYDSANNFSEGFALVSKGDYYYYVNFSGELTDLGGELGTKFGNGCVALVTTDGSHYVDSKGTVLSDTYDEAGAFSENMAPVRKGGKWGYINNEFDSTIDFQFDEAGAFENGYAVVKKDGKKFLIDTAGMQSSPPADDIWMTKDSMSTVMSDDFYGYATAGDSSQFLIDPQYFDALGFAEGKAPVSKNEGIWYYVNADNNPVFGGKHFDEAYRFTDGLARVKVGSKYAVINEFGEFAFENQWEHIGNYSQNILPVYENEKWGYVSLLKES